MGDILPAIGVTTNPGSVVLGVGGEQLAISWQVVGKKRNVESLRASEAKATALAYSASGREE